MTLAAVLLAAATAALLVPGLQVAHRPGQRRPRRLWPVPLLAGAVAAAALRGQGHSLALVLVLACAAAGAERVVARARAARAAGELERQVVELCEALADELRAGQPPRRALEHCAATWRDLDPVARAERLGADVPAALRRLAARPGAEALRDLASAWQVSAGTGAGLAVSLTRVAESARHQYAARMLVGSELASARATAWLVALLPVASLGMAAGMGGDPWTFLLATTPGLVCLAAGVALALAGLSWVDRIAAKVQAR